MARRWTGAVAALGLAAGAAGCGKGRADGVPDNPLPVPHKSERNKMAVDREAGAPTAVKRAPLDGK